MGLPTSNPSLPCYNLHMGQKPLIETNPYLRDPEKFRKALMRCVASSTAIETGQPIETIVRMLEENEEHGTVKNQQHPI